MTITTEVQDVQEVTQAKQNIFIHGIPVTYTSEDGDTRKQATYDEPVGTYSGKHQIILLDDGVSLIVRGNTITPNRELTDSEMVTYLTEQILDIETRINQRDRDIATLHNDHDKISTALKEEAENRGWCKEYNTFCEEVNSTLEMSELLPLEQEYEVNSRIKAVVEIDHVTYVTATSQEHADSMVDDDSSMFFDPEEIALEHVKSHGFDSYDVELS